MSRSRVSLVALVAVIVLGLLHIYADQRAGFVPGLVSELDLSDANSSVQAESSLLVQEILDHDKQILEQLEDLKLENAKLRIRSAQFMRVVTDSLTQWKPLRDLTKVSVRSFISEIQSREPGEQGPPELFEFPSSLSHGRHLCFKGNDTHNGTRNSYTFAWEEALPKNHLLLNGTTLISETEYDYNNPWHSMYNLIQFVHWKLKNRCNSKADRLIIYHWSELRRIMGGWITQVFTAAGLPTELEVMADGDRPVCFEKAVVSRLGIAGVPIETLRELYAQVRCQARALCELPTMRSPMRSPSMNITLMVRSRTREWKDPEAWERVIDEECGKVEGCRWRTMWVGNMTYCEQVKRMMETDVLVSVHGAQLTNMIFMSPGGRVLEMFPKGWLEIAGGGQFIYKQLAKWNGLRHEGYWRDIDQPDCPTPDDRKRCWSFHKDQSVGINASHVASWLGGVLVDFKESAKGSDIGSRGDHADCACMANGNNHQ